MVVTQGADGHTPWSVHDGLKGTRLWAMTDCHKQLGNSQQPRGVAASNARQTKNIIRRVSLCVMDPVLAPDRNVLVANQAHTRPTWRALVPPLTPRCTDTHSWCCVSGRLKTQSKKLVAQMAPTMWDLCFHYRIAAFIGIKMSCGFSMLWSISFMLVYRGQSTWTAFAIDYRRIGQHFMHLTQSTLFMDSLHNTCVNFKQNYNIFLYFWTFCFFFCHIAR